MPKVEIPVRVTGARQAERQFDSLGVSIKKSAGHMVAFAAAGIGVQQVVSTIGDLVKRAGQIQGVENAFRRLGINLEGLRESTGGTITDFKLMQTAVKGAQLGITDIGQKLAFAKLRARETGESVEFLAEQLILGLGRKSIQRLDDLGISLTAVREKMEETGDFAKAVAIIINEELAKAGTKNLGPLADRTEALSTSFSNAYDNLARLTGKLAEADAKARPYSMSITGLFDGIARGLGFLGDLVQDEVIGKALVEPLEKVPPPLKEVVDLVKELGVSMAELDIERMPEKKGIDIITKAIPELEAKMINIPKKAVEPWHKFASGVAVDFDGLAGTMVSAFDFAFSETLVRGENFFDSISAGFTQMLERMVSDFLARSFIFGAFSLFGGGGLLGAGAGFLNFATGGLLSNQFGMDATVGGSGAPDSKVFASRVSPGERIQITPEGESQTSGITVNINARVIDQKTIAEVDRMLMKHRRLH